MAESCLTAADAAEIPDEYLITDCRGRPIDLRPYLGVEAGPPAGATPTGDSGDGRAG